MAAKPLPAPPLAEEISTRKQAIWFRFGAMWEAFKDPHRALVAYEAVLRLNQTHVPAMVKAGVLRQRDHVPTSISYLATAVRIQPGNGPAWASLAYSYIMAGDFDKAYHAYSTALAKNADRHDPHLWHGVGLLYDRLGLLDDAIASFGAVLSLSPAFEKSDEVFYALGVIYKEKADYNNALGYMSKVTSLNTTPGALAEANYQIALIHELAGNPNAAAEAYSTALGHQGHVKAMQSYAWLKHKMGKSPEAIELLQRALQIDDADGSCSYLLGRVYMANNEYRVAYDNYQRAVHLDGNNANYWCSIAALYYQRQQHRDAMDAFTRAMDISPNIPEVWYDLGTLYETYNQYNDALNAYRRAIDLQPQSRRFAERYAAIQHFMQTGVTPQPPNGRPASDEILPIPSAVQRVRYKTDAPVRYGPLPPPPDTSTLQAKAPEQNHNIYQAPTSAVDVVPRIGQSSASMPHGIANGHTPGAGGPSFSAGAPLHTSNASGAMAMATRVAISGPEHSRAGPAGIHGETLPNGGPSSRHPGGQKPGQGFGNQPSGGANGVPHSVLQRPLGQSTLPAPPRVREQAYGPVSPGVNRSGVPSHEHNTQSVRPQEPLSMRVLANAPGRGPTPMDSNIPRQPLASQPQQSVVQNGVSKPEVSQRDDSAWRPRTERVSADSRALPDPFNARPEVSPVNRDVDNSNPVHKPTIPHGTGYSAMGSSPRQGEHGTGNEPGRKLLPLVPSPNAAMRSPTARSNHSNGREVSQEMPKYSEMHPSNSAAGNSASSLPTVRRNSSPVGPAASYGPKPSNSEEPSRRSVSSSHERAGVASFPSKNPLPDASQSVSPGTGANGREHPMSAGDRQNSQKVGRLGRGQDEATARPFRSPPRISVAQTPNPTNEKGGSPVDEEMLPKLPPLPSTQEERRSDHGTADSLRASVPNYRASDQPQRDILSSKEGLGGGKELRSRPSNTSPVEGGSVDARRRAFSENDASGRSNGLDSNHRSQAMSHSQVYRSAGLDSTRMSGLNRHGSSVPERVEGTAIEASSKANGQPTPPHGVIEPGSARGSTTALTSNDHHRGVDRQGRPEEVVNRTTSPHAPRSSNEGRIAQPVSIGNPHVAEQGNGSKHAPVHLGSNGSVLRDGRNMGNADMPSRDSGGKRPESTGMVSAGGGLSGSPMRMDGLSRDKPSPRRNSGNGIVQEEGLGGDGRSQGESVHRVSSIRNPFGSGAAPSFSKSLSRPGAHGPLGIGPGKLAISNEASTKTGTSEGLRLRSSADDQRSPLRASGEVAGLGKRTASAYENGGFKPPGGSEFGRFMPKTAVIGPSVGKPHGSKDELPHRLGYEGIGKPFLPGRESRTYGDERRDLKRGKPHHPMREPYSTNRFNGDS